MSEKYICYNCFRERPDLQENPEAKGPCPYCGFDLEENVKKFPVALRAGTILNNRYIVGRVLGQGGFGITYLAYDTKLAAKVAVKEFMPNDIATRQGTTVSVAVESRSEDFAYGAERFKEEARTLAKFMGQPNIAGVTDYFDENDTSYFVMDYIEGISFKTYIANAGGKVSVEEALDVMIPVLRALTAVHGEGFIHRDVTPDNIYITKDGNVKLLDFGSARYSIGDKSKSLDVILKVGYAPKEQYIRRGRQGPYTDVYSCAACLYAAITGYLPPESLERLDQDTLVPPSQAGAEIPEYLERAILKGLAVQPEDRFQTAAEFLDALENQRLVEVPAAQDAGSRGGENQNQSALEGELAGKPARKRPLPLLVGGAAAAVILAVGIGYFAGGFGRPAGDAGADGAGGSAAVAENEKSDLAAEVDAPKVTIAGEEYSTAAKELRLEGKGLTDADLVPLGQMTNLEILDLRQNSISDLSPLSDLTSLRELYVDGDLIEDLSPLSGLVNLERLHLAGDNSSNGRFTDLTPLKNLTKMRTLHLPASGPTSLAGLEGMTQLEDLALISGSSNLATISDISALSGLTQMKEMHLNLAGVGDLSPLSGMTRLESLEMGGELAITDLSPLAPLTRLQNLEIYGNGVQAALDLTPLAGMTEMVKLRVPSTVVSLEPLKGMTKLQSLELSDRNWSGSGEGVLFSSLEPLSGLTSLTRLTVRSSLVTDLTPLSGLENLQSLTLNTSNVTDLSPLSGLEKLTSVSIDGRNVTDWSPVDHVPVVNKLNY